MPAEAYLLFFCMDKTMRWRWQYSDLPIDRAGERKSYVPHIVTEAGDDSLPL